MKNLLVLSGPTASGKTALAEQIAIAYQCPIISADSRQFYKEIPIGTAQPSRTSLKKIEYYFVANLSLQDEMSAGQFERDAGNKIIELFRKHDLVIVCGGSGLYIKALLSGLDLLPEKNEACRNSLIALFQSQGIQSLMHRLPKEIYNTLNKSDQLNPQRLMRHIEIAELPQNIEHEDSPRRTNPWREYKQNVNIIYTALSASRETLYRDIDARVDQMMAAGFENEVRQIPLSIKHINALQTVGYKELFDYISGDTDLPTAVKLIKQHTRNYAKKQLSWLRREQNVTWFDSDVSDNLIEFLKQNLK